MACRSARGTSLLIHCKVATSRVLAKKATRTELQQPGESNTETEKILTSSHDESAGFEA